MLSANFTPKNSCGIARFPCDSTAFLSAFSRDPKWIKDSLRERHNKKVKKDRGRDELRGRERKQKRQWIDTTVKSCVLYARPPVPA